MQRKTRRIGTNMSIGHKTIDCQNLEPYIIAKVRDVGTSKLLLNTQFLNWRKRKKIDKEVEEE
jgi:hypothetical protein